MNTIREIQNLNRRELENVVSPEASWHSDYRNTAYVHISGLGFDLTEGDVLTIFSQFGEPTFLHLARDKETGKSRGFGWLKYEDQRSTDLAVDNLGGASILGRTLKVDHAWYKRRDDETEEEARQRELKIETSPSPSAPETVEPKQPLLKEELELRRLIEQHDEDDPMKEYLVEQKREEVERARKAAKHSRDKPRSHHRRRRRERPSKRHGEHSRRERSRDGRDYDRKTRDKHRDKREHRRRSHSQD